VVAPARGAVDKQVPAPLALNVGQRHRFLASPVAHNRSSYFFAGLISESAECRYRTLMVEQKVESIVDT